jgi:hypothetical protein
MSAGRIFLLIACILAAVEAVLLIIGSALPVLVVAFILAALWFAAQVV